MSVSIRSLESGYGANHVLHGIDFEVRNELVAVVGSNGSGKSTLLKSLCGLCDVYGGTIRLGRDDITDLPTHRIARLGVSYMAQNNNVFSELSVYENLVIASVPNAPNLGEVGDLFPALLRHRSDKASHLSGGLRQMLAMAMIVQKSPSVIAFDEPTANLSPKNAKLVLDKIRQIQSRLDNCVILVEQNVKEALQLCKTCYLLSDGRVAYSGPSSDLLADDDLGRRYLGLDKK